MKCYKLTVANKDMYVHSYVHLNVCQLIVNVRFNQSTYSVNENEGPAQPTLVLNTSSSIAFTVQVTNTDGSATGKY